jgi:hypothetical protein
MGVDGVVLEDHGDLTFARLQAVDEPIPDVDLTARDGFQVRDHPQQRRLAASRGSDEDREGAWIYGKIQPFDHRIAARVRLLDLFKKNFRHSTPSRVSVPDASGAAPPP